MYLIISTSLSLESFIFFQDMAEKYVPSAHM